MTVNNALGPFGFSHWTLHDADGGDDAGDDVQLGEKNTLSGGDAGNATLIENSANVNMALAVQNFGTLSGVVGVYGRSDGAAGGGIGVAGACDAGWGVAGVATTPTIDPGGFPGTVGVFGAGDVIGIYGQSRPGEGQLPTTLPPPSPGTGIYGIGDVAGVEGDCDGAGTGVVGESTGGKGVIGESVSAADIGVYGQSLAVSPSPLPASPGTGIFGTGDNIGVLGESARGRGVIGNSVSAAEIGVYGQSLAVSPSPLPASPGTGVFGTGDHIGVAGSSGSGRGAVFTTGSPTHPPVAQAQLVPVVLQQASVGTHPPPPFDPPPQLPRLGRAGDVLAATVQIDEVNIARLWFCAQSGTATQPALWAEISFSRTIAGTGP